MQQDLTQLIERVPEFEKRLNVVLDNLFAAVESSVEGIAVRGELRPSSGNTLDQDLSLTVTVFDANRRIIKTNSTYFDKDKFFGFETFDIDVYKINPEDINKLRVHIAPA